MGRRGPHGLAFELWLWEKDWYRIFKGLRDGEPSVPIKVRRGEWRRLSTHPDLAQELHKEPKVRIRYEASRTWGIPAERKLWYALLKADSVPEVRAICRRSKYWLNPHWRGYACVRDLFEHGDLFLAAKNHPRFPCSARPSSDDKRMRFLARAMAAISLERKPRRAIDVLGKKAATESLQGGERIGRRAYGKDT